MNTQNIKVLFSDNLTDLVLSVYARRLGSEISSLAKLELNSCSEILPIHFHDT